MLVLLRIFFTGAFIWLMAHAARQAHGALGDDLGNAGNFALAVVVGLFAGLTWAPLLGSTLAGPLTGLMTDGSVAYDTSRFLRFIRRCEARGWRRLTLMLAFWECVLHPKLPAAFVIGFNNARPGSWLEKVFALEVWRFNNITNCVRAHGVLVSRHHINPGTHVAPEVNVSLMAQLREPGPELAPLAVPEAPPPPLPARNRSIQLFPGAGDPGAKASETETKESA